MRALVVLLATLGLVGCLGDPSVRAVLLTETIELGDDAPASARAHLNEQFRGCPPGTYDAAAGRIRFETQEHTPRFAVIVRHGDTLAVMAAGSSTGAFDKLGLGILGEQGNSGGWGFSGPFITDAEDAGSLQWGKGAPTFNGDSLEEGKTRAFETAYNATWKNDTFSVKHYFEATYLGRVPYSVQKLCT